MIKSIELNNYRIYKGINKIVFQNGNNKNLFLISGKTVLEKLHFTLITLVLIWSFNGGY